MEKPTPIKVFDVLFAASMMLAIGAVLIDWHENLQTVQTLKFDAESERFITNSMITSLLVAYGVNLLLWYLVSRRRSNVARWILTMLFSWGFVITLFDTTNYAPDLGADLIVWASNLLWAAMLVCLFLPGSASWFNRRHRDRIDIRDTFD